MHDFEGAIEKNGALSELHFRLKSVEAIFAKWAMAGNGYHPSNDEMNSLDATFLWIQDNDLKINSALDGQSLEKKNLRLYFSTRISDYNQFLWRIVGEADDKWYSDYKAVSHGWLPPQP
jgi:hypothetical protein